MIRTEKIGGIFLSGGKTGGYFGVILELYQADDSRWVVKSLFDSQKVAPQKKEEEFINWILNSQCQRFVTDIPPSKSFCERCEVICPGEQGCSDPSVKKIKKIIEDLLGSDLLHSSVRPKDYERKREAIKSYDHKRDWRSEITDMPPLSPSFKRKLKNNFLPYWHRSIDLYIWINFHDNLLKVLNYSFDSFGHTSLMIIKRFEYLKNILGNSIGFYESNTNVVLLQLLKSKIISRGHLNGMRFLDETTIDDKKSLIRNLEKNLNLFAYESDILDLILGPKMINAFLLALSGCSKIQGMSEELPDWCEEDFIIPNF